MGDHGSLSWGVSRRLRSWRGYTLVELLVVLAVLALLAGMAMPLAEMMVQRDKERELKRALWAIRDAIDDYRRAREQGQAVRVSVAGSYPPNLAVLVGGLLAAPDGAASSPSSPTSPTSAYGAGTTQRFMRRIPRDPFADASLPAEQTWGLRSYQSDADNPRPGSEVYDVYSKSERVGLNGVPLRQW